MTCAGNIWSKFKWDILCLIILLVTSPLFFYNLGQSSLVNWDEAWYGDIARNILKRGDLWNLFWNGKAYIDHPPMGFWLTALTFQIFGISEFWARFPQATAGLAAIIALYLLGKELFNRVVGFSSALALISSFWFLYRARSGNLDISLTLFFILSIFLAIKASKDKKFLLLFSISLAFLFLSKTLVPLTIIPALLIIFWGTLKFKWKELILPVIFFLVLVGSWLISQVINNPGFFQTYIRIGFPEAQIKSSYIENLKLFKEYLHSGVGKWFWPGIFSAALSLILRQKSFLILSVFVLTFSLPFAFSHKGQIWHLIPLHPFLILSFFGFLYTISFKFVRNTKITAILVISVCVYFSFIQIRQAWYQFIDIPAYISDEAILAKEAGKYSEDLYIDGADFTPTAVFYSGKNVSKVWRDGLGELFDNEKKFVLITYLWRLDNSGIPKEKYRIIKTDRDKILIIKI
ncbi:hypothetical protein A2617_02300 [Candidatus Daviesbacteria bacterium RIFOXYD1_FULL_41_10]|uniref:Dolichyl-phosphate-mannose-protein mannosyltransferase family protein n=2 Tax=Bacteria candidate phyla TaxID=1783234 RepID=A0A0G0IR36_9BACT|nr:MAG: Dolichyl-phosphate-mannose-protein mannosyltransferase family protein [Berkelbacteria bacterium GW2011_GWA1_36_9]OGE71380.1 MAG: hypothetical protein A2617_02300 [Candidatus Daviesbacteria bacterium RIFOXYD1_FULL_41_10]